ncbi:MAG: hypothetical protein EOP55_09370 [Sphingobacteriales bacterium]|nr:MAG: hypothetical protein EOP55_09370 [Sphingobacteriales bacterium]
MKKFIVTVEKEITIEFDETSPEFIEMFKGYKRFINSSADYESLSESIASLISRYGVKEMIEGVGFLKHNGENQTIYHNGEYKIQDGLVNVDVDTDLNSMVDFEIAYTRED